MQKSGVHTTIYKVGGWEKKQLTLEKTVAKAAGKGAKFVILSSEKSGEYNWSRWINGVGRCTRTVLCYRVTYVVLPKTKKSKALRDIIRKHAQQQVDNITALFLPATKTVGMKESVLRECFKNLIK